MLIEIQCQNILGYDAKTGEYEKCEATMIVSSEKVGEFVNCSRCNQQVEIRLDRTTKSKKSQKADPTAPTARHSAKSPPSQTKRSPVKKKTSQSKRSAGNPKANSTPNPDQTKPANDGRRTGRRSSKRAPGSSTKGTKARRKLATANAKKVVPSATGDEQYQLAGTDQQEVSDFDLYTPGVNDHSDVDKQAVCKKCGNDVELGMCVKCKMVQQGYAKLYAPLNEIPIGLTGFQRWFCSRLGDPKSIGLVLYFAHFTITVFCLMMIGVGVAGIYGYGIGKQGGIILLSCIGVFAILYISFIWKGRQFTRKPRARLTWFQRPFWNFVLTFCRLMQWQYYDVRLKGRNVIRVRHKGFGDDDIMRLEGIKDCSVLDLQKTLITDKGLAQLYDLHNLQCLVLRKTRVSAEGVFRFQQTFPHVWVWH